MTQWQERARRARAVLVDQYWDGCSGLFRAAPGLWPRLRWSLRAGPWHYWWQAHALGAVLDGVEAGDAGAGELARRHVAGITARCGGDVTANDYYDDLSWLGLATVRAHHLGVVGPQMPLALAEAVLPGRDPEFGGFRWRVGDDFHNVAASAPAAILLAESSALAGDPERWEVAARTAEWIHANVVDSSGAVWDGCRPRGGVLVPEGGLWSYNVGTVAGLDVVIAAGSDADAAASLLGRATRVVRCGTTALRAGCADVRRAHSLLVGDSDGDAAGGTGAGGTGVGGARAPGATGSGPDPAITPDRAGAGSGRIWRDELGDGVGLDPQLFRGILAQYACQLVLADPGGAADIAADIVDQAGAAWSARDSGGRISAGWAAPARGVPSLAAHVSGVLTIGSAARLERAGLT